MKAERADFFWLMIVAINLNAIKLWWPSRRRFARPSYKYDEYDQYHSYNGQNIKRINYEPLHFAGNRAH